MAMRVVHGLPLVFSVENVWERHYIRLMLVSLEQILELTLLLNMASMISLVYTLDISEERFE